MCISLITRSWFWCWFTEVFRDTRRTIGFIQVKLCVCQRVSGDSRTWSCINWVVLLQINWHVSGGLLRIDHPCAEARRICSIEWTLPACCVCPRHGTKFCVDTRFWHAWWDTTIIMAVHNNDNILMVHHEDLPDKDEDTINKATEEFQKKCLLSYTKTHDSTVIQNFHYQEFYYMDGQIQLKLKTSVSSWKP